jgi:hypothetical protein
VLLEVGPMQSDAIRGPQRSSEVLGRHFAYCSRSAIIPSTASVATARAITLETEPSAIASRRRDEMYAISTPSCALTCHQMQSDAILLSQRYSEAIKGPSEGHQRAITRQSPHVPREGGWLHARSRGRRRQSRPHC